MMKCRDDFETGNVEENIENEVILENELNLEKEVNIDNGSEHR